METVLITGGTGLIGRALTSALVRRNYEVIVLSRKGGRYDPRHNHIYFAEWNIHNETIDIDAIAKADYIIHLAGAGVADKRWTEKRKREIVDSRVRSSELLVKTLRENENKVKSIVSASGVGWYGPDPVVPNPRPFKEEDPAFADFLGSTCKKWQESIASAQRLNKRVVFLRTGIVLSKDGGALSEFKKPLKFGIAAILGNGKQIVSWIHIDDLVRIYIEAMENEKFNGAYNAVAPSPVSNKELTLQLARIAKGKLYIPIHVPSVLLKLVLGEMSIEVLKSATASAEKIRATGFTFSHPTIGEALKSLDSA